MIQTSYKRKQLITHNVSQTAVTTKHLCLPKEPSRAGCSHFLYVLENNIFRSNLPSPCMKLIFPELLENDVLCSLPSE